MIRCKIGNNANNSMRKVVKKKKKLSDLPSEIIRTISHFLDNRSIISLLCTSRMILCSLSTISTITNRRVYANLFTTFCFRTNDNVVKAVERYLTHRKTIQQTTISLPRYGSVDDAIMLWPFTTKRMLYVRD